METCKFVITIQNFILDKVSTLVSNSPKKMDETFALCEDVDIFFEKIAKFDGNDIELRAGLYKKDNCHVNEIVADVEKLGQQWKDPQYKEFSTRVESIMRELIPTSSK